MNASIRAMVRVFSVGERQNVLFKEAITWLSRTFHLSPHQNILYTTALNKTFIICIVHVYYLMKLHFWGLKANLVK